MDGTWFVNAFEDVGPVVLEYTEARQRRYYNGFGGIPTSCVDRRVTGTPTYRYDLYGEKECTEATVDADQRHFTVTGIDADRRNAAIDVTLAPYDRSLAYTVDGTTQYMYVNTADGKWNYNVDSRYDAAEGTWTYTAADGRFIAKNGVSVSGGCSAEISVDNRTVTVRNLEGNNAVTIKTTGPSTGYYMGDMSFEYTESAAAFTWDGNGTPTWTPLNQKVWRHTAGSKTYTDELTGQTYTVANGSILFVNGEGTAKTYTIKLTKNGDAHTNVKLVCTGGSVTEANGAYTVTVPAGGSVTVVCSLTGAPDAGLSANGVSIGEITVTVA